MKNRNDMSDDDFKNAILICGNVDRSPDGNSYHANCACGAPIVFSEASMEMVKKGAIAMCNACGFKHAREAEKGGDKVDIALSPKQIEELAAWDKIERKREMMN